MFGPNPDAWEALQENPDQDYQGEGEATMPSEYSMYDPASTLRELNATKAENEQLRAALMYYAERPNGHLARTALRGDDDPDRRLILGVEDQLAADREDLGGDDAE